MPIRIVTADERMKEAQRACIAIFGPSGVGKTFLARTLESSGLRSLFLDGEGGMLAINKDVKDAEGTVISPRFAGGSVDIREEAARLGVHPWVLCRGLACLLAGPDPADYELMPNGLQMPGPYARESWEDYRRNIGEPEDLFGAFDTIFVDSITVFSRWSFAWANTQPDRISKDGKVNKLGAYGLHGTEMIRWLTTLQHAKKTVIVVGILDKEIDDLKRVTYSPQIEGSKAGRELPGIFDEVLTIENMQTPAGEKYRAFVCHQNNEWGFPAKDRSGHLSMLEEPHLGKLLTKLRGGDRIETVNTALPAPPQPATPSPEPIPAAA